MAEGDFTCQVCLAVSRDIFGWIEGNDTAEHATMHRTAPDIELSVIKYE